MAIQQERLILAVDFGLDVCQILEALHSDLARLAEDCQAGRQQWTDLPARLANLAQAYKPDPQVFAKILMEREWFRRFAKQNEKSRKKIAARRLGDKSPAELRYTNQAELRQWELVQAAQQADPFGQPTPEALPGGGQSSHPGGGQSSGFGETFVSEAQQEVARLKQRLRDREAKRQEDDLNPPASPNSESII